MTPVQAAGLGRAVRVILLLCTAFGLAAMHSLGHAGVRPGAHGHAAAMAGAGPVTMIGVARPDAAEVVSVGHCPDGHCPGQDHGGMGWAVCLAVLGGLAVAVLLAALLPRRPRPGSRPGRRCALRVPRPPPRRWMGLTVASVAVLRV